MALVGIAMDRPWRKCGAANGNILSAICARRAVLDPLAAVGDHCLTSRHIDRAFFRGDPQHSAKNDRVFIEFGRLSGFDPTFGTLHAGNAQSSRVGVYVADKLLDHLGFVAGGLNDGGFGDVGWHAASSPCAGPFDSMERTSLKS